MLWFIRFCWSAACPCTEGSWPSPEGEWGARRLPGICDSTGGISTQQKGRPGDDGADPPARARQAGIRRLQRQSREAMPDGRPGRSRRQVIALRRKPRRLRRDRRPVHNGEGCRTSIGQIRARKLLDERSRSVIARLKARRLGRTGLRIVVVENVVPRRRRVRHGLRVGQRIPVHVRRRVIMETRLEQACIRYAGNKRKRPYE